jgi:chemotaxis protein CheC
MQGAETRIAHSDKGDIMEHTTRLKEISAQAANQASQDLSKLTGKGITLEIASVDVKDVNGLEPTIKRDELVSGVYVPITGEIPGSALLILPPQSTFYLSDLMVGREEGATKKLTKLDESALEEVGNIIACSYIGVLGNRLQAELIENPPVFQSAVFGALLQQSITNFAQRASKALTVEIQFVFKEKKIRAYLLLLFGSEALEAILKSLDK